MCVFFFIATPVVIAADDSVGSVATDTAQEVFSLEDEIAAWTLTQRIIGGKDADADSWPSLVALVSPGTNTVKDRFFCAGTVVADRWVMTAAHCLYRSFGQPMRPSNLLVVAGIRNLETDVPNEETIVSNIYIHPEYNYDLAFSAYDIALLELGTVIDAPAVSLFAGDVDAYVGSTSYIAGWGATQFESIRNATYPSELQDASVPIVSRETCNADTSYQGLITQEQLCAGFVEGGVDACVGDSGGPLFIIEDGIVQQMGITSYGNGCGLANYYGVYSSVSHLIPWLGNYIEVPYQSPELVAQLASGEVTTDPVTDSQDSSDSDSSKGGVFIGAVQPIWAILLVICLVVRRRRFY